MEDQKPIVQNSRKIINAWCSYDIANSAYNLSISTVLYPIYYESVTKEAFGSDIVSFLGVSIKNTVLYEYAIAAGYLVVILLTLLLSGIADAGGYRKRFMQFFTLLGSMACMGLYWFDGYNLALGVILPALAVIGFAGSLVYYNSFLPIIASPDRHDKVSARGFSFGYAGSMILLIFSLYMIENIEVFGFSDKSEAVRFSFLEVGIWWLLIAQIAFYFLKEYPRKQKIKSHVFTQGFKELANVFRQVRQVKTTYMFLIAFFFLSMGVQTIILVASLFGITELGISGTKLIVAILIIQIVAIAGALLFGIVSSKAGNKISLVIMLSIWIIICISAYFVANEVQFYVLASLVGLVMGGIQSQARSTFSKLIPTDTKNTASFFSFYDSTEKLAIVLGMFSFGLVEQITHSMRISAIVLSLFFVISLIFVALTRFSKVK